MKKLDNFFEEIEKQSRETEVLQFIKRVEEKSQGQDPFAEYRIRPKKNEMKTFSLYDNELEDVLNNCFTKKKKKRRFFSFKNS
ncbi:MAG: hypothetical protein S4CHLAM102_00060 [Chlamydiia bacterium]|nr:hypothetical protein [Chlamydiia bacterium]